MNVKEVNNTVGLDLLPLIIMNDMKFVAVQLRMEKQIEAFVRDIFQ